MQNSTVRYIGSGWLFLLPDFRHEITWNQCTCIRNSSSVNIFSALGLTLYIAFPHLKLCSEGTGQAGVKSLC